jgi:hypothetical protein
MNTHGPHPSCGKEHMTFDEFAVALPNETATDLLEKHGTSRLSSVDLADILLGDAKLARAATKVSIDGANAEARDVVRECVALADLGEWFGHKYRGATALAVFEGGGPGSWLEAAKTETRAADAAYTALAKDTEYIAPFAENMRMRKQDFPTFHWKEQLPHVAGDLASIDEAVKELHGQKSKPKGALPDPKSWLDAKRHPGPGLAEMTFSPDDAKAPSWTVTVTFAAAPPHGAQVHVLHRPFRSNGPSWESVEASGSGTTYKAKVPGDGDGAMFAVEVNAGPGQAWRYPDVTKETPYRALAP